MIKMIQVQKGYHFLNKILKVQFNIFRWACPPFFIEMSFIILFFVVYIVFIYDRIYGNTSWKENYSKMRDEDFYKEFSDIDSEDLEKYLRDLAKLKKIRDEEQLKE